jgi:hypothetical protein
MKDQERREKAARAFPQSGHGERLWAKVGKQPEVRYLCTSVLGK